MSIADNAICIFGDDFQTKAVLVGKNEIYCNSPTILKPDGKLVTDKNGFAIKISLNGGKDVINVEK